MAFTLSDKNILDALLFYFNSSKPKEISYFRRGAENTTALLKGNFGRVVLRIWGERHSRMGARKLSDIDGELAFMEACRETGVAVPKMLTSLGGNIHESLPDGRLFGLMEYVEGEEPSHFTPTMIEQLATSIAKMNVLSEAFRFSTP